MSSDMLKIGQFAQLAGVSVSTLRNWDASGKLTPAYTSDGGTRFYTMTQLKSIKGEYLESGLIVVICSNKENLALLMNSANSYKKMCNEDCNIVIINNNELEAAVYYMSEILDKVYDKKPSFVKVFAESDNFIQRLLKQTCNKNELQYDFVEVK